MKSLEQILSTYDFISRTDSLKQSFEEVEGIVNFKIPEDYKVFAQRYTVFEDFIGPEYLRLWDFEKIIEMNTGYFIFEDLTETLAIGGNGGGEYIALEKTGDGVLRIILSPFITIEKAAHIEIGTSFTDFLQRLESGKEWFS